MSLRTGRKPVYGNGKKTSLRKQEENLFIKPVRTEKVSDSDVWSSRMKIYTLVGKSGTGKSFHAMDFCRENRIDGIIDDGLFIYRNTVIAGVSAKKAETKVGAIKTAMFFNEEHRGKVAEAIKEKKPSSLLILGTSDRMTDKIIEALGLPADDIKRVYIEDITSEEDRAIAREQRDVMGKHVIPAPTLQLKHTFSGYFLDPIRLLKGREQGMAAERTVVRPTYSYMGDYIVSDHAISDMADCVAEKTPGISRVIYLSQVPIPENYSLDVAIEVKLGYPIWETAAVFQRALQEAVENMTAFSVMKVDVEVRSII